MVQVFFLGKYTISLLIMCLSAYMLRDIAYQRREKNRNPVVVVEDDDTNIHSIFDDKSLHETDPLISKDGGFDWFVSRNGFEMLLLNQSKVNYLISKPIRF